MPRVERSPPASLTPTTERQLTLSTPDLSEQSNVTARNKRLRPDFSPDTNWTTAFENRIMNLLNTWKKDQDIALQKLTSDIAEVKQQNVEIEKSIEFVNTSYESMRRLIEKLERERMDQREYIITLEKKIEDLQHSSRSSTIEIRNIPQRENESTSEITSTVLETCKAIHTTVTATELRDVYRMPGKKGTTKPIICEFTSVNLKHKILEAVRNYNKDRPLNDKLNTETLGFSGPRHPIYIGERLPGIQRQLFYEARNFAKQNNYKFCWTRNGRLFLREKEGSEAIEIKTSLCLKRLKPQHI